MGGLYSSCGPLSKRLEGFDSDPHRFHLNLYCIQDILGIPAPHHHRHRQPGATTLVEHQPVARGQTGFGQRQPAQGVAGERVGAGDVDRQIGDASARLRSRPISSASR